MSGVSGAGIGSTGQSEYGSCEIQVIGEGGGCESAVRQHLSATFQSETTFVVDCSADADESSGIPVSLESAKTNLESMHGANVLGCFCLST